MKISKDLNKISQHNYSETRPIKKYLIFQCKKPKNSVKSFFLQSNLPSSPSEAQDSTICLLLFHYNAPILISLKDSLLDTNSMVYPHFHSIIVNGVVVDCPFLPKIIFNDVKNDFSELSKNQ